MTNLKINLVLILYKSSISENWKWKKVEIEKYQKTKDPKTLRQTHISYSGSPHKHPYDSEKMIMIIEPYYAGTFYYEFNKSDIAYIDELPNLVNLDGEVYTRVRIWIKKASIGVRCIPFVVGETPE